MKNLVSCVFLVLAFFAFVDSAEARSACFDWACDSGLCSFDASCSDGGGLTPKDFRWNFGDGPHLVINGPDPTATHGYTLGGYHTREVTLWVGFLFVGYYQITCNVIISSPIGPPGNYSFSGTCS